MMENLKSRVREAVQGIANRLEAWAARLGGPPDPPSPPPADLDPEVTYLPPFSGTPEEAAVLWQLPPVALIRKRVITRVDPQGQIRENAEIMRLSAAGKIVARIEFSFEDDFGVIGPAALLKGRCRGCGRASFQTSTCHRCGVLLCPACARPFDDAGKARALCEQCHAHAEQSRHNW